MTEAEEAIHIREADRSDDAAVLSHIAKKTFVSAFGNLYSEENIRVFLDEQHTPEVYQRLIADPKYGLWLASDGDVPVAYAVAGPCGLPAPDLLPNAGEIKRVYVDADCRSAGLGGRLMDRMLVWLGERYGDIYLSVYADNEAAHRFYARHGFQKVHEYHFRVGEQLDPEWIMKRPA